MFATMRPYLPPPPSEVQPPPLWGSEEHVRALLGDRVTDVRVQERSLTVDGFADAAAFRDYFKACYGPTIAAYRGIAEDPEQVAALDHDLLELVQRHDVGASGRTVMEWEYLLLTARKRARRIR
jgi:hypothetical protein